MSRRRVFWPTHQQIESAAEALHNLTKLQDADPCCRELNRERQSIETHANLCHCTYALRSRQRREVGPYGACSLEEQIDGGVPQQGFRNENRTEFGDWKRGEIDDIFESQAQRFATGH